MEQKTNEKKPKTKAVLAFALSLALMGTFALAQTLEVELQRAIQTETVTGDLKAAIDAYAKIAARAGANRAVAAQALLKLAQAHQKLGDVESRKIYERIVREFSDQATAAAEAKLRLAALGAIPAAASGRAARQIWVGVDVDTMGSLSADGRYLSYTDWATGDLAVRDFVTGTSRRLTNTGGFDKSGNFAEFSVVSPDGRYIAYAWFTDRGRDDSKLASTRTDYYDLRVMPINGGSAAAARVVYPTGTVQWIRPCAWTADGKHIVVVRSIKQRINELGVLSLADGSVKTLKEFDAPYPSRVSLSPDDRYLVYDKRGSDPRGTSDVFVLPLGGGVETAIVQSPANDSQPFWSPDGSRALFVSDRSGTDGLWSIDVADGKPRGRAELVAQDTGRAVLGLTNKGGFLYVKGGGVRNVYLANVDAEMKLKGSFDLLSERIVNVNAAPAWSPDGQSVAYYSSRGDREIVGSTVLVIRAMKSGEEREIALSIRVGNIHQTGLRWFADGQSLLVVGRDPQKPGASYYRVDASSGKLELLRHVSGRGIVVASPQPTPDARAIIFADGQERIVRLDLDTNRETELATGWFGSISISPDGAQLAFVGNTVNADSRFNQLVVMPSVGGPRRVLFESSSWSDGSRFNSIGWSHDQKYLLFARDEASKGGQTLWRVPASGGAAEKTGIEINGRIKAPNVHPNGGQLVFAAVNEAPQEVWLLENFLPRR